MGLNIFGALLSIDFTGDVVAPEQYVGVGSAELPRLTASGAGTFSIQVFTGSGSAALPSVEATGTGAFALTGFEGAGSATLPAVEASGTGTYASQYVGSGSAEVPGLTAASIATYESRFVGSGSATIPAIEASNGSGTFVEGDPTFDSLTSVPATVTAGDTPQLTAGVTEVADSITGVRLYVGSDPITDNDTSAPYTQDMNQPILQDDDLDVLAHISTDGPFPLFIKGPITLSVNALALPVMDTPPDPFENGVDAVSCGAVTGMDVEYRFRIYSDAGLTTLVEDSGWQASNSYVPTTLSVLTEYHVAPTARNGGVVTTLEGSAVAFTPEGETYTGAGSATIPALTASGSGTHVGQYTGAGSATIPALTANGSGTHTGQYTGSGAAEIPGITASGSGTQAAAGIDDPNDIAGLNWALLSWRDSKLESDDVGTEQTVDGGSIERWTNMATSATDYAANENPGTTQPTLLLSGQNSKKGVRFDGDSHMTSDSTITTTSAAATHILVFEPQSIDVNDNLFALGNNARVYWDGSEWIYRRLASSSNVSLGGDTTSEMKVLVIQLTATTMKWAWGDSALSSDEGAPNEHYDDGGVGIAANVNASGPAQLDMYAWICYDAELSQSDIDDLRDWIASSDELNFTL